MPIKLPELLLSDLFLENLDDFMIDFSEKTPETTRFSNCARVAGNCAQVAGNCARVAVHFFPISAYLVHVVCPTCPEFEFSFEFFPIIGYNYPWPIQSDPKFLDLKRLVAPKKASRRSCNFILRSGVHSVLISDIGRHI